MATSVEVSFPDDMLARVDGVAREEQLTRDELLCRAVRLYLNARRGAGFPSDDPLVRRAVSVQDDLSRMAPGDGEESSAEIRSWRRGW